MYYPGMEPTRHCLIFLQIGPPAVIGEIVGQPDEDHFRVKFGSGQVQTWPVEFVSEQPTLDQAQDRLRDIRKAEARAWRYE